MNDAVAAGQRWVAFNGWVKPHLRGRWAGYRSHDQVMRSSCGTRPAHEQRAFSDCASAAAVRPVQGESASGEYRQEERLARI